jgi:two-component system response regulator AtoC
MAFGRGRSEMIEQERQVTGVHSSFVAGNLSSDRVVGMLGCGQSAAMLRVRKLIEQSAASDLPVLITGEVGVGKEAIAREIHRLSARTDAALLEVNCSALSEDAFASGFAALGEHVASLASTTRPRTLLLNGIGELSAGLQEGLLRLLRRGGEGVQLIAATHRDLQAAVEQGRFSEDLFYRLNLIHIHVPPLRAHREDVPALIEHFLRQYGQSDGSQCQLPEVIRTRMLAYDWPGNARELENAIRSYCALRDTDYVLEELDARTEHEHERHGHSHYPVARIHSTHPPSAVEDDGYSVDLKKIGREASDAAERDAILAMLTHTLGNKKAAARRLGISYKALLYKIRDYGIFEALAGEDEGGAHCGESSCDATLD